MAFLGKGDLEWEPYFGKQVSVLFESELPMGCFYQESSAVFAFINRRISHRRNSVIFCREDLNICSVEQRK